MQDKVTKKGAENVDQRPAVAPPVDVFENADEFLLVSDMPGVAKDAVHIDVHDGELSLVGRRSGEPEGAERVAGEFRPVDFRRQFVLPQGIDYDKIEAQLSGGVLRVRLPKADAVKPRKIAVKAG